MGSQYQGSQAFNQSLQSNEYVNKNTGSLVVSQQLVQLRGITDAIGLDLSMGFSAGAAGQLGLPQGWSFGLPFVAEGASLTVEGKTFVIDPNWTDSSGYQSGLRYLNDHGRKFETIVPPQPLPGGGGTYGYRLTYDDGSISYFDPTGKLMVHADLFGNTLRYDYTNPLGDVFKNSLSSITDSFGQVVGFGYSGGTIIVTLPGGSDITISFSSRGVQTVTNQIGASTTFAYATVAGADVIGQIDYATGLRSTMTYTAIAYIDGNGNAGSKPAVQTLVRTEGGGTFLDKSAYSYGTMSGGNTYTGSSSGYRMGGASDGLMDSNNTAYQYDVLEQRLDANDTLIAATRTFFDFLHTPQTEHSYLIDAGGNTVEAHRNTYTYDIVANMHARSVNMSKPVTTLHSVYDPNNAAWRDNSRADTAYDLFGKVTSSAQYDLSSGTPKLMGTRTHTYVAAPWGGEMPQRTDYLDAIMGQLKRLDYALTTDMKSIAATTVSTQASSNAPLAPYKTKNFSYDAKGRQVGWTLTWAPGYTGDVGAVTTVSETSTYSYDSGNHQLTHATTDANGHTRSAVFDMRLPAGPCLNQTKPSGALRSYSFDALARVTSATDALGSVTTHAYTLKAVGGSNTSTVTNANGYETLTTYDAKGRPVLIEDNGDPTQSTPALTRVLRKVTFNALDLKSSETDATGQVATFAYDGLGRQVSVTDALGNVKTTVYADATNTISTSMNGDLRSVGTRDGLGNVIGTDTHADSTSPQAGQIQRLTSTFDGFGQVISEAHGSVVSGTATQNSVKSFTYTPDGKVSQTTYAGTPADSSLAVQKVTSTQRDLNGNPVQVTRDVSYDGTAQPTVKGEILTYDPVGNLIAIVNQSGQSETMTYNDDSAVATRTRYDGTATTFGYDAAGQVLSQSTPGDTRTFTYLSNGRTASVTSTAGTVSYDYSLDGTASKVTYSDGKTLVLNKDSFSRVMSMTLPDGTTAGYTYNAQNQIIAQSMGAVTLSNTWGTANHSNGILLRQALGGPIVQGLTLGYDGFGDSDSVMATDAGGATILSAQSTRDTWRNLIGLTLASQTNADTAVNVNRIMTYDGLKQLVSSTSTPSGGGAATTESFVYDGVANVLSRTIDGQPETFTYNALNQLTVAGVSYDTNGRMITDQTGASFAFDPMDRLTAVKTTSGDAVTNSYGPDGALQSVSDAAAQDRFYPLTGAVVSVASGPQANPTAWHNLLWSNLEPVARVSAASITAYNSAAKSVRMHRTTTSYTALNIAAYGDVTPQSQLDRANSFNWNSQYSDPVTNLTYLRSRWYAPGAMRFMSLDPRITVNRYAYGLGNPIANDDPLGQSWEEIVGIVVGAIVGIVATVATGGAAGAAFAAVFGTESVAASVSAGALAGAVGSVAGDMTSAGISGQKITGARVGIDLLSGAVGGAVGAGLGGGAGRIAMRGALSRGMSQAAITRIGMVTSGAIGGLTGAAASAGVTSIAYQQPFFSTGNIISMAVGFGAGAGGGILTSGAYLGMMNSKIIPVPLGENELHLIQPAVDHLGAVDPNERLLVMAPQPEADQSAAGFANRPGGYKSAMRLDLGEANAADRPLVAPPADASIDTIAGHGAGNTIFASVGGDAANGPDFVRPITGRNFARYLVQNTDFATRPGPVKLMSCFGAWRNAQVIADALNRDVWAGYSELDRYSYTGWTRFQPGH